LGADRLYKIRPVSNNLVEHFRRHYKPPQKTMIPWRERLSFRTYNPGKLVKYEILAHMACEATTGYIGNIEKYTAEDRKLEESIFSFLEPYLDLWHYVYQDNYYNGVEIAEKLLLRRQEFAE
jgi:hypothetical protein